MSSSIRPRAPKRPAFEFYTRNQPNQPTTEKVSVRHVRFNFNEDERLSTRTSYISAPASPQKKSRLDETDDWVDEPASTNTFLEDLQDPAYLDFVAEISLEDAPRKRTPSNNPVEMWAAADVDDYLAEMIRLEGRGDAASQEHCAQCPTGHAEHRCMNCFGAELFCGTCIVLRHRCHPLHRIQRWNGSFFEKVSLKSLGLRVQLGHPTGQRCLRPCPATNDDFCVIHVNGIHDVSLDFCGCETAEKETTQLLRCEWFPATVVKPKTAATFRLLEHFHLLNFESKASAFEFYHTLFRETNNTGVSLPKDRYQSFMDMMRMWRHVKLLKRSGRGHDPAGVSATIAGECAVLCPACPQVGKNIPDDWENAPPGIRWLYALFLAIDANFRLKRKLVSSIDRDPGLSKGWSYFVEESGYKAYLKDRIDLPQEKSTCTSHDAVNQADSRCTRGIDSTGVGCVQCARHNFMRPSAVGDLQKGEKYVNMDYLVFSTLSSAIFLMLILSYDIVCQWYKNLWKRMSTYPSSLRLDSYSARDIVFLVPKFHLPAHVAACQTAFSFNLTRYVGRTDGEAPERGWSDVDPLAPSTKEMGPGSRHDLLDDHWGDWNYKKVIALGRTLLRKIKTAVDQAHDLTLEFQEFDSSIEYPDQRDGWRASVQAWEADNTEPNPYVIQTKAPTQNDIRLRIAQEEAAAESVARAEAATLPINGSVSPSVWISTGLDLEDQQLRLGFDSQQLGPHATSKQLANILERSNALRRKILAWREIQALYIPGASILRERAEREIPHGAAEEKVQDMVLWLPSAVNRKVPLDLSLELFEYRLRFAQAQDALNDLRHHLRFRSHLYTKKDRFSRGVAANTRSKSIISRTDQKVKASAKKYRIARTAVKALAKLLKKSDWELHLPRLKDEDIRGMAVGLEGETEGRRTLSWIWRSLGAATEGPALNDDLRVEWCKARARAMRWSEEVELLLEEMRRVLQFLRWHAGWWQSQGSRWTSLPAPRMEGVRAYAERQASLRRALHDEFVRMWTYVTAWVDMNSRHDEVTGLDRSQRHDGGLTVSPLTDPS